MSNLKELLLRGDPYNIKLDLLDKTKYYNQDATNSATPVIVLFHRQQRLLALQLVELEEKLEEN